MSLWTRVAISTQVEDTTGTLTLTEPAGVQAGDLLVACISYRQNGTQSFTSPSGWSNAAEQTSGNNTPNSTGSIACGRMDYIVRGGSAPALAWTRTSAEVARGQIEAWRRSDGGVPAFDQASSATDAAAGTTGRTTAALTQGEEDTLYIMACCNGRNATASAQTSTGTGAFTERDDVGSATGNDVGLAVASVVRKATGTTGAFTWTTSASHRPATIVGAFRAKFNVQADQGAYAVTGQSVQEPGPIITLTDGPDVAARPSPGNTATLSTQSIGPAEANRYVLLAVASGALGTIDNGNLVWSGATIDGSPMDELVQTGMGNVVHLAVFGKFLPAGTTADFVLTAGAGIGVGSMETRIIAVTRCAAGEVVVGLTSYDIVEKFSRVLSFAVGPIYSVPDANKISWSNATEIVETCPNLAGVGGVSVAYAEKWESATGTGNDSGWSRNATGIASDNAQDISIVFRPSFPGVRAARGTYAVSGQNTINPGVNHEGFTAYVEIFDADDDTDEIIYQLEDLPSPGTDRLLVFLVEGLKQETDGTEEIISATLDGAPITMIDFNLNSDGTFYQCMFWSNEDTLTEGELRLKWDTDLALGFFGFEIVTVHHLSGANTTTPVFDNAFATDTDDDASIDIAMPATGLALLSVWGGSYSTEPNTSEFSVIFGGDDGGLTELFDIPFFNTVIHTISTYWTVASSGSVIIENQDDNTAGSPDQFPDKLYLGVVFSAVGQAATLVAAMGEFAISGQDVLFRRTYIMPANNGSYAMSGQDVNLFYGHPIAADFGSFIYTGQDVAFLARTLAALHGTFSYTGQDAAFLHGRYRLTAEFGSFSYTGQDVLLLIPRIIADFGEYAYTGQDVAFLRDRVFSVVYGTFETEGQDASFTIRRIWEWVEESPDSDLWEQEISLSSSWSEEAPLTSLWAEEDNEPG